MIAEVAQVREIADLTLREPDIEDVVARLYRGEEGLEEAGAAGTAP